MNIHEILLNMQLNQLIFEFNRYNYFDVFETFMLSLKRLINFRFILNFIFIKYSNFFNRFTLFNRNKNRRSKKLTLKKIASFQSNIQFFLRFDIITRDLTSYKLLSKMKIFTNIVIINAIVFYKLHFRKNKATDVKCYSIIIFEINNALSIYCV